MPPNFLSPAKWLRRISWFVGAVALLWGLGWLALPGLIRSQLEKHATEQLGRKVTVGAVDFRPWTLELTLSDLAIANQAGSQAQFEFKRLYVNAELESLMRLAPVVDAVRLEGPVAATTSTTSWLGLPSPPPPRPLRSHRISRCSTWCWRVARWNSKTARWARSTPSPASRWACPS